MNDEPLQRSESGTVTEAPSGRLDETVAALDPYLSEAVTSTEPVINRLLDVWGSARNVDPHVSSPVRYLLTVLVQRTSIMRVELIATMDHVRTAALHGGLLVDAPAPV